ncbi:MAG: NAD-dependent epimerase/dehydratase family protein [Limisphaerales bacterium]
MRCAKLWPLRHKRTGWQFCWGRVFYPYGVGEHPARLCSSLIQKLQRGEKLVLKTPHSRKDYIYIEDLGRRNVAHGGKRNLPAQSTGARAAGIPSVKSPTSRDDAGSSRIGGESESTGG